jgi:hypothetical protein
MRLTSRAAGLFSAKLTAGLGLAGLVLVGGAVAAAATSGSTHPDNWGKVVTTAVQECKAKLTDDQHGIGKCVSAVASQKGREERGEHSPKFASPSQALPADGDRGEKAHRPHPSDKPTSMPDRPSTEPPGHEPSPHPGNPQGPPHH